MRGLYQSGSGKNEVQNWSKTAMDREARKRTVKQAKAHKET
jgi:hypothetical protein